MAREFPAVLFERYVDDAVVHCLSERQARFVLKAIMQRIEAVGLAVHPDKTWIVYCRVICRRMWSRQEVTGVSLIRRGIEPVF